jgi:hypothetical protein
MKVLKYLLTVSLLIFCINAEAQTYEEVVYLSNGSIIRGTIIEQTKEVIKIKIIGGSILVYQLDEVERITKEAINKENEEKLKRVRNMYQINDSATYYHSLTFSILMGVDDFGLIAAPSFHYVFGYQYKPLIGLGVGTGIDSYNFSEIVNIIPLYLEARGYLYEEPFSPYYSVKLGYGFPLQTTQILEASGGLMVNPKIGFRLPSRTNVAFVIELGALIQNTEYTTMGWTGIQRDDVSIRRYTIGVGMLF